MATLVAPLVSGIVGADSGTAEFYSRGTTTPVVVYSDPDGSAAIGKSVTLDANGGYEAYATESVFVRVRDTAGVVVREFTVVHADNAVDVESASFTGTLASGSQGAGGMVDARTVLDRWYSSAGALDWKVRRSGNTVDETLVDALDNVESSNQPMFNVRTYGATGDGVTNDYQAFVDCYNAAVAFGGGIVYVPAGSYLLNSAFTIASQRVSLKGAGAAASIIISGLSAGTAVTVNAGASTFSGTFISDLQITNAVSGAAVVPLQIISTPGMLLRNVQIKNHGSAVDIRSRVVLQNCDFTVPTSATAGDYVVAFTSNAADTTIIGGTFTQSRATNTGAIHVSVANVQVLGAKVDISAITPGAGYGVDIDTAGGTRVVGCNIITGAAATFGIRVNADVAFSESDNTFSGSGRHVTLSTALSNTTRAHRGSRIGRTTATSGAAGTHTPDLDYEQALFTITSGAAATIADPTPTTAGANRGARLVIQVTNGSGGALAVTFSANYLISGGAVSIANNKRRVWEFIQSGTPLSQVWVQVAGTSADL